MAGLKPAIFILTPVKSEPGIKIHGKNQSGIFSYLPAFGQ
jgi:hypothetical protein